MSTISVDYDVLNQRGSPAWFTDTFANIPTAGYVGRMFISTDTFAFYRDTGTGWDLIGGPGIGTLTGSGVVGQVSFFNGTQVLAGNNNLFWDNTNSRLGINTTTPGQPLDIHSTGNTLVQLNNTTTANSNISFQNQNVAKWRVGNVYNAGANSFNIENAGLLTNALTISSTTNNITLTGALSVPTLSVTNVSTLDGNILLKKAGIGVTSPTYVSQFAESSGVGIGYSDGTGGANFTFPTASISTYTFPASTGTIALTSNIPANIVTGTGASGQVGYWTGTATQSGSNNHFWDNTNNRLGINTTTPLSPLQVVIGAGSGTIARFGEASGTTGKQLLVGVDTATGRSELASIHQGTSATPLALNPTGGNVLVGTTTDAGYKLNVSGTGNFSGTLQGASANFSGILEVGTTGLNGKLTIYSGFTSKVGIDMRDSDDASNAYFLFFRKSNGNGIGSIQRAGLTDAVLFNTTSDYRLKEDYKQINGIEKLSLIKVYDFKWKGLNDRMDGVIAHELQEILPYAVSGIKDGLDYQGVDYSKLVPILIKSIQELNDKLIRNNIN